MADLGIALSVHAPWAWALMFGGKDVENRGPKFPRRRAGRELLGRVWVHASLKPNLSENSTGWLRRLAAECRPIDEILEATGRNGVHLNDGVWMKRNRGHIVGSVEVYGYAQTSTSPWYVPDSLAILVRNPQPLAKPVPARGALGWWTVPEPTLSQVRRAP